RRDRPSPTSASALLDCRASITCRLAVVTTFEACGGLHCHVVFISCRKIAERLRRSKFDPIIKIARVTDPDGLVRRYLAKERTQVGYRRSHVLGGRLKGSHQLPGGGDRVRLSLAILSVTPAVETDRNVAAAKFHDSDGGDRRGDENQRWAGGSYDHVEQAQQNRRMPTRD